MLCKSTVPWFLLYFCHSCHISVFIGQCAFISPTWVLFMMIDRLLKGAEACNHVTRCQSEYQEWTNHINISFSALWCRLKDQGYREVPEEMKKSFWKYISLKRFTQPFIIAQFCDSIKPQWVALSPRAVLPWLMEPWWMENIWSLVNDLKPCGQIIL